MSTSQASKLSNQSINQASNLHYSTDCTYYIQANLASKSQCASVGTWLHPHPHRLRHHPNHNQLTVPTSSYSTGCTSSSSSSSLPLVTVTADWLSVGTYDVMTWHDNWFDQILEWCLEWLNDWLNEWMNEGTKERNAFIFLSIFTNIHFCYLGIKCNQFHIKHHSMQSMQSMDKLALYSLIALSDSISIHLFWYNNCPLSLSLMMHVLSSKLFSFFSGLPAPPWNHLIEM